MLVPKERGNKTVPPQKNPNNVPSLRKIKQDRGSWILACICQIGKLIKSWSQLKPLPDPPAKEDEIQTHSRSPALPFRGPLFCNNCNNLSRFTLSPTYKSQFLPHHPENTPLCYNPMTAFYQLKNILLRKLIGCYSCAQQRQKGKKNRESLPENIPNIVS